MDLTQLNTEILSALDTDPTAKSYLTDTNDPKYKNWSKDELGYVRINGRIFVPESGEMTTLDQLRKYVICDLTTNTHTQPNQH